MHCWEIRSFLLWWLTDFYFLIPFDRDYDGVSEQKTKQQVSGLNIRLENKAILLPEILANSC